MADRDGDQVGELLEGLSGRLRAGRERLVRELRDRGYSADELRTASDQDRLAVLLLEDVYRETASLTARDVAAATGIELDEVLRIRRLLGLSAVTVDEPAFDDEICSALRVLQFGREYGLSQSGIDELLAVLGQHMWQLASDVLIIMGNEFAREHDTEYELAHRYADATRVLAPAALPLVASACQAHVRERMREIFVTPEEAEHGSLRAIAEVTVAFVDVEGFTELGERVEAGELKAIATRLADAASALIEPPVRLVKTVGDAILLMSRETGPLLDVLVKLISELRDDRDLPAVHVGVARGPAHVGGADVYGAPVNLASRLTDLAPTRRIWADESVAATFRQSTRWHVRGPTTVKGLQAPVMVFELDPTGTVAD